MTAHVLQVGRDLCVMSLFNHANPIPAKMVELVQSLVIACLATAHQIGEDPTVKVSHQNILFHVGLSSFNANSFVCVCLSVIYL